MLSFLFLALIPNPSSQGHLVPLPLVYFQTNYAKDLGVVCTPIPCHSVPPNLELPTVLPLPCQSGLGAPARPGVFLPTHLDNTAGGG